MQVLSQGEYVGTIKSKVHQEGIYASISSYNQHLFNGDWHCHENAHISFVLKGGRSEQKKNLYECVPGKATFYVSGEPHQIINMYDSMHVNLEMDDDFFKKFDLREDAFGRTVNKTPDAKFLMLKVYRELLNTDDFVFPSVQMLLLEFLHQAEKWSHEEKIPEWMSKVHELMNEHWSETITLSDLSLAAGVHPVTISHYFPKFFDCTLGAYMRKLKVEKALELLKSGQQLSTIAYTCGFFDQSHFIRTFKQLTGFLPAHYQKM